MRSNLFELHDVLHKSFSASGARPHILLTLTDDAYHHSNTIVKQLSTSLSRQVIRIPQSITEYTVDEYLSLRSKSIVHLPFFAQRSKQLLLRLLRIIHSTDHTLVIGAEHNDVNELISIVNVVDVIITDSDIFNDSIDDNAITYLLERIASSNVDRNVELLRRYGAAPTDIFSNVVFGQLLIRGIDLVTHERIAQHESVSITQEQQASSFTEEKVYDELQVALLQYGKKRKMLVKASVHSGSRGGGAKQRFTTHGRPNRTLVRNSRSGMLSLFNTLLAAAPHQVARRVNAQGGSFTYLIEKEDIRRYPYELAPAHLEILVLDSSGSMAGRERIRYAKGLIRQFVKHSYQRRLYCSLIVARSNEARVVVMPTRRTAPLLEELKRTPTGGKTPLCDSLVKAIDTANTFKKKEPSATINISLLTDGKDNFGFVNIDALRHALKKGSIARRVFDSSAASSSVEFAKYIGATHHLIDRTSTQ